MRLITKLWATLLLLCVAGVTNAATEYEIDQRFTSVAALDGQKFVIVNETDNKAIYNSDAQNLKIGSFEEAMAGASCEYVLESFADNADESVREFYALKAVNHEGANISFWGNAAVYLNSGAPGGFNGCFILGNGDKFGTDFQYGGLWKLEYVEGQGFTLKNKGTDGYFAGASPAPSGSEPIYWTLCTLKEKPVTDPLADQKDALTAAIAKGGMINALAYTEASFATLTAAVSAGETVLAASDATAESLTGATTTINDAIAALVLKDGFTLLTADMYKSWNDNINPTEGTATGCAYVLFEPTGQPYGDSSAKYLYFADLSEYSKLYIGVAAGTPRIMMNRQAPVEGGDANGGDYVQITDAPVDGLVTVDLTQYDYAHLNAIKGANWQNVTVSGMYLYKASGEQPVAEKPATPTFTPAAGEYFAAQTVTIACETEGAAIYYTLDGTAPTAESALYAEPIAIAQTATLKAIAIKDGIASEVAEAAYTITEPLFADGTYYIYNKGAQKFLAAGSSWGTHAVVNETGLDYIVAFANGKYTLDSQVSNGGNNHFLNGEWNDGGAMGWIFAPVEGKEGVYTISNGTQFLTAGEDGRVTLAADATVETAQWTLKTLEARIAELATATSEAPVNATFLIQDANFGRNDLRKSAWKMEANNQNLSGGEDSNGSVGNNCAESYHSTFALSQVIANAPAGKYKMTAQGFYRQDGSDNDNLPVFYANDKTGTFPLKTGSENSMTDASKSFTAGNYTIEPIEFTVFEDGQLTIGAKLENNTNLWCIWDNFQLTYVTKDIPADEFEPAYTAALAAAKAAKDNESYAAVTGAEKTALEKAISDYETIAEPTADTYRAAISALTNATTAFTAAKADYEALAAAKAAKAEFDFAPYPYASEAKIAAAKATLTAEATSGADAKAKTEAIDKAFRTAVESNALLEGVLGEAENMTDSIKNPNALEAIAEPWAVVLGEGSGGSLNILDGEPLTDGTGSSAYKYFDGGNWGANAWDVALEQTITLPAGKYYLTAAGRAAADVDLKLFAGENSVSFETVGASGALFGRGWSDASVEFEMAEAGEIKIGVRGVTDKQYQWMSFTRFRLIQFPVAKADAAELVAPEGWVNLISNGNLAGDDVSSYVAKEYPATDPSAATIVAMIGKDNSRGILVKSQDKAKEAWDSQFWINLNQTLPAGSKLHVEFDYKADKAGSVSTQSHGNPGGYKHWACIGNVNFKGEWQHFSADVDVAAEANDMQSIAFNLNDIAEANNYYFDNFGVWAQIPEKPTEWTDIIVNGNMEGEDNSCFYVTEQGVGGPFLAPFTAGIGKDGSKAVKVQSADGPTNSWDTQFFIRLPYQLPAGTQYKVSFDYKAEAAAKSTTQMHANPGDYIHYIGIGDVNFTTDWQTFEYESVISSDQSKADKLMQTIAFNLAELSSANLYIFDNVKFEISADVAKTLEVNPNPNAQPYPVPEVTHTWDFTKWSEATIANLKAEAAKVTVFADPDKEGNTMCTNNDAQWTDHEKAEGKTCDTYAASKDNCFWSITTPDEAGQLSANGEAIAEFKGLAFNAAYAASRALAIAVNYPSTSLGTYNGPAYLWFGGKGQEIMTIKGVKAGTQIKIGVESHKSTDARGVKLFVGETELTDPEGAAVAAPTTYVEQTWAVPAGEGVVDVVVKNTNGCHIYFIDAEIGEAPEPVIPEDPDLIEIEQEQQDQEGGVVTLATVEKDEKTGVTTYTTKDQVCVIFKMKNVDVKDCDYILFKFAEPIPEGLSYAFWTNNKNKGLDKGLTEFKYVFADDAESEIKDNVIPEISLLTIFGDAGKIVKVAGVYKHKVTSTGIETVKVAKKADVIYNLRGQKVNKAEKGLFIINGRKVVK